MKTQKAKEKRVDRMEATGLCTCGRINDAIKNLKGEEMDLKKRELDLQGMIA